MLDMFSRNIYTVLTVVASVIVTAVLIYATPLQYTPFLEPTVVDISSPEFYEMYTANPDKYLFYDVRPVEMYNTIHAKGSVSMPLHTFYDTRHTLPKDGKEIILICSGGRASGVAYSYLEHFGFSNMKRISGGIEAYMAAGLPTESLNLAQ